MAIKKGVTTLILNAKQKADMSKQICEAYANGNYTIQSCCESVGIPERTFRQWLKETQELADAYARACEEVRIMRTGKLREVALTSLEKLCGGYDVIEETREGDIDPEDATKIIVKKVKTITRHIQPNVNAVTFTLQSVDADTFGGDGPKVPTEPQIFLIGGKEVRF